MSIFTFYTTFLRFFLIRFFFLPLPKSSLFSHTSKFVSVKLQPKLVNRWIIVKFGHNLHNSISHIHTVGICKKNVCRERNITTTKSTIYIGYFKHITSVTRHRCSLCRKKLMHLQQRLSTTVLECTMHSKTIIYTAVLECNVIHSKTIPVREPS